MSNAVDDDSAQVENRLKFILGEQMMAIAVLRFRLEKAEAKIVELEKSPHLQEVKKAHAD